MKFVEAGMEAKGVGAVQLFEGVTNEGRGRGACRIRIGREPVV